MPRLPLRPCTTPGCPRLTPGGPCPAHTAERARGYDRATDARRGTAHRRGYGVAWRRLRLLVLREEPLCRACLAAGILTPTEDIDHIVGRARGGTDDRDNLQGLCHRCHTDKTNREDGGGWPRRR